MNFYSFADTIRKHLNLVAGVSDYLESVHERTINVSEYTNLNGYKIFVGCTFVFDEVPMQPLHLFAVCGCTFVCLEKNKQGQLAKIDYCYYSSMLPEPMSCYLPKIIESRSSSFRIYCMILIAEVSEAAAYVKQHNQENNLSKLQFSYSGKDFSFSSRSFSAGVELEIPVSYDRVHSVKYNRRHWFMETDNSQLEGDLEVASLPTNMSFLKSERFFNRVTELYSLVQAPTDVSSYVDHEHQTTKGSGIHVHISWHKQHNLSASEVREFYYKELASRGGLVFCLTTGGKSFGQFQKYSPYLIEHEGGLKYDCVNVVNERHVELRWLANDPDPTVVCARIKLAIDIFETAVLELYRQKIATSTRIKLWTIQPHFKLLPKAIAPQTTLAL